MPRCPGQDQRFWKPDDIFETECPHCGVSIEFWKDEPSLKCPTCKKLVVNPKLDLGCATWCQHAEQCLGTMSSNDDILCKRLIREAKQFFGRDQQRIDRMLRVFQLAQEIVSTEEADSRLVNAAAIVSDIEDALACKDMLFRCGVTDDAAERVCLILATLRSGDSKDSLEARIVSDAIRRAEASDGRACREED